MKHLFLFVMLILGGNAGFAQTDLLHSVNCRKLNTFFLQQVYSGQKVEYNNYSTTPIYSYLGTPPNLPSDFKWHSFGDYRFSKNFAISVAMGFPLVQADVVGYIPVAYTKGDFALTICWIESYQDILEDRVYTYDYNGHMIDSLIVLHQFVSEKDGVTYNTMPLCGAVMSNLDVVICEINWLDAASPFDVESRTVKDGQQKGQRIDSYYSVDESGHFILKKQTKYLPMMYSTLDIAYEVSSLQQGQWNTTSKGTIYEGNEPVLEVIEY